MTTVNIKTGMAMKAIINHSIKKTIRSDTFHGQKYNKVTHKKRFHIKKRNIVLASARDGLNTHCIIDFDAGFISSSFIVMIPLPANIINQGGLWLTVILFPLTITLPEVSRR